MSEANESKENADAADRLDGVVSCDGMTKDEAIQAMDRGETVTHNTFTPDEWMRKRHMVYEFEDGVTCPAEDFWMFRKEEWWNTGWKIYS